jgi:hypothetical protein
VSNNNDLFVREVDDEIRQDQLKSLWNRFGPAVIGLAVLIVVGVAGWRGYESWNTNRANVSGDRFLAALVSAREGNTAEALKSLEALQADGTGAYPLLAKLRAATLLAADDPKAAVAAFDAVAADTSVPGPLRDVARLRAAYILIDHGTYADVAARAEALSSDGNAMRHSAREALGLAAWKAGEMDNARVLFQQLADDADVSEGIAQRAQIMLALIGAEKPAG